MTRLLKLKLDVVRVHESSHSLFVPPKVHFYLHKGYMLQYESEQICRGFRPYRQARIICYANDSRTSENTPQLLLNKYCVAAFIVIR